MREALASTRGDDLAAILIDISRRREPFIDDVHRLKVHLPGARIVLTAESWEKASVLGAMRSEVDGFLLQTIRFEVVVKTLELILLGERIFPSSPGGGNSIAMANVPEAYLQQGGSPRCGLSVRELEVLRLLAQGSPNKVIARDLGLAEATVKVHVKAILRKASVRNRTEAALWAREVGV